MTVEAARPPRARLPAPNASRPGRLAAGLRLLLPVAVIALALVWSFSAPDIPDTAPPPYALTALTTITLITIAVIFWLRRGLSLGTRTTLALPLPLSTLYLATVILADTPGAVALAALSSLYTLFPHTMRGNGRLVRIQTSLRQAAVAAVTTLAAGMAYGGIASALNFGPRTVHARLVAGLAATLIMLIGVAISRILDRGPGALWSGAAWRAYLGSPAFGFQVLLLSVGPLLPLVEILDDAEAELAWVLFLVPLYAIYYLSLLSVRLQQRTDELQRTIGALGVARQREVELTGYAALVTRAQEEERRRLARELHDDTAQTLVALSRGLDTLATRPADPPLSSRDRHFLEELGSLAKRSLESIRRACQNLRPSVLDDLGLAPALESLVTSLGADGLRCVYTQTGEPRPCPPEIEVTIYRIAQEAISNALRHAGATHLAVELGYSANSLRLVVRDDGRGFDTLAGSSGVRAYGDQRGPEASTHLGLLGMRERAALIGAELEVASVPGEGTTVTLRVPASAARTPPPPSASRSSSPSLERDAAAR